MRADSQAIALMPPLLTKGEGIDMTYVKPERLPYVLPAYLLGGLLIGASIPPMQRFAAAHFGRAGYAVAFVVNIAMPVLVVSLAAIYPRLNVVLAGTLTATLAFLATIGLNAPPLTAGWLRNLLGQMGPILVVACIAYHVLAAGTVAVLRPFRRVGRPPDPAACIHCGYLLIGLPADRCPECGRRQIVSTEPASTTEPSEPRP